MHYEDLMTNTEQGILKTLKNLKERIIQNTESIENLKGKYNDMKNIIESQERLIDVLLCVQDVDLINLSSEQK